MLVVHRAERADRLARALAEILAEPLADPFTAEVVAVPSRGIERWLGQQLSNVLGAAPARGDGIFANVDLPFPARLVGRALHAVTGIEPDADPWSPARSVWPLLEVVDAARDDESMVALARHVGRDDAERRARRFAAVRHVADLFDRYEVHRPSMVVRWAAGDDVDVDGEPLAVDARWQPRLWRRLRELLGVDSPAQRLGPACELLRAEPGLVDLPPRLALFGLTRLPPSMLAVLDALAVHRDVHLMLLHPSPAWWARPAADDERATHPLLSTWGRDACSTREVIAAATTSTVDRHHEAPAPPATLLGRLQAGVIDDRPPPGAPPAGGIDDRPLLDVKDTSVQLHACHGRARQVEVLRDAILHLLADDPTLEPRDVIVMCPEIETFAPLVHAAFGSTDELPAGDGDARRLQVRLADRAVRQINPVLAALSSLLDLAGSRLTAAQLTDFAGLEAVRRRFRFDDDALARLEEWIVAAGVRWGLDAAHRAPFKLDVLPANTWHAGLDRLLLGVSMSEDDLPLVGDVLPLDDVDSGDIDLAGRFAELVARVGAAVRAFAEDRPMSEWAIVIAGAVDALTAAPHDQAWQRSELDAMLGELAAAAGDSAVGLSLAEVRSVLGDELRGRPSRANFRTGHLTVCTLVPMRSVPHRVVCLLGLDDGAFPRHGAPDGDDLLVRVPRPGDHDVRSEDRQLLLDALMAAGDHLVVTYSGRDERTNAVRPPAVPISELLDVIDATVRTEHGPTRASVVTEHPLQPFDARNFVDGALRADGSWSFDPVALGGAVAQRRAAGVHHGRAPFLTGPLPPLPMTTLELDDLVRFVEHPVRAFLRQRLGITVGDIEDEVLDAIPVELDGLATWRIGDRLLAARLAGADWDAAIAAERVRGELPPGPLGGLVLDQVMPAVEQIHDAVRPTIEGEPAPIGVDVAVDVPVDLTGRGGTTLLAGTVGGVRGATLLSATYSSLGPRQRLAAWVRLLALSADGRHPGVGAVTVGRRGRRAVIARIPPVPAPEAVALLRTLVDLYARGMREPLPLWTRTSYALAGPGSPRTEWETAINGRFPNEDRDRDHVYVLGNDVPFAQLLDEPARADEVGAGWSSDRSRAARYAHRLWDPLLGVEVFG